MSEQTIEQQMAEQASAPTVLCLSSYVKGADFMRACKRLGCRVILLTVTELQDADWPREDIDDFFHMPDLSNLQDTINGVSYLARTTAIDHIVALDDYDVEVAAALREHLRLPGLGASAARYFRDKLAMRVQARDRGILVPDFVHVLNYNHITAFTERVPPPWVLKPRSEASSIGITRIDDRDQLWQRIDTLGDRQSYHLLERYVPGDVYHVDSIVREGQVVFAQVHRYGRPPMDVYHGGGMFVTRTVQHDSGDERALLALHQQTITAFGYDLGAAHMEFIKGRDDGRFYFLETAARVGGANIVDLVEAATGANLWAEWAAVEIARDGRPYQPPGLNGVYGGLIVSLARQEYPDTSAYQDPEIVWRLTRRHHVGLLVASPDYDRVTALLDDYTRRIREDFTATLPPFTGRPPSASE